MSDAAPRPAVLAIVVATNGAATLPRTLAALSAQTYRRMTVVGVDNGSQDESRGLLVDALGPHNVLVADRDLGFGNAVGMALDAAVAEGHELVLLVHDDLELHDDAVEALVAAMEADESLAVVGCKLVEWEDPTRLQAVGMSVDVTGRADPGVEEDELDQGQHDHEDRALYVSTAGMMLRRDRFEELGRFDHRYHLFRDDLDLCWRAWLAGWSVEVVTDAVGSHEASASTYRRLGQTAFLGPRYFAERNTLATLLKNYGMARLLLVLPLFLVVGVAKVAGFVATRRLGDAWQTVRAWLWNLLHLRETWRLRDRVQLGRQRGDGELQPLFAQVTTRLRAYGEALGEVLSGASDAIDLEDGPQIPVPQPSVRERTVAMLRTSAIGAAGLGLLVLGAIVAIPLFRSGGLQGGELSTWTDGAGALLQGYAYPWSVDDLPAVASVRPSQVLLAAPTVLSLGSAAVAPRLLLLAVVPVAWVGALAAGRLVTARRLPRAVGALIYALSPPVLAALRTGRVGDLVAVVLLPIVVLTVGRAVGREVPQDRAWRATAVLALSSAGLVAAAPGTAVLLALGGAVVAATVAAGDDQVGLRIGRLLAATVGAGLLVAPWMPSLDGVLIGPPVAAEASFARALVLTPALDGFGTPWAGVGLAASVLLGLAFGGARRAIAAGLGGLYVIGVVASWAVLRGIVAPEQWAGTPLLFSAIASGGLAVLAFSLAERQLAEHDFGWRQLAAVGTAAAVAGGILTAAASIAVDPWVAYDESPGPLPAFLATEVDIEGIGPFRVLVLDDADGVVRWSIADADGPGMASWGHELDPTLRADLEAHIARVVAGGDPAASTVLGRLGIRYVVAPEGGASPELDAALRSQLDLVAQPVSEGLVLRVVSWLPRWSVLPLDSAELLAEDRPLPPDVAAQPLASRELAVPGLLVLGDAVGEQVPWRVTAGGRELPAMRLGDVVAWQLGEEPVTVEHVDRVRRPVLLGLQGLVVLLALSLSVRAPRFAREVR